MCMVGFNVAFDNQEPNHLPLSTCRSIKMIWNLEKASPAIDKHDEILKV